MGYNFSVKIEKLLKYEKTSKPTYFIFTFYLSYFTYLYNYR